MAGPFTDASAPADGGYSYTAVQNPLPVQPRRRNFLKRTVHKLGLFQLFVLVVGNIGLLVGLGVLRYLWPWASRGESDRSWKEHVLSDSTTVLGEQPWEKFVFTGWLLRVITLSSIVIRVSMASQATVFCMVMASIALQRSNVLKGDLAAVAIYRFTNSGPQNMILPLLRTRKDWKSTLAVIATIALALTTLASQFTSTILLTDIGTRNLRTSDSVFDVAFGGNLSEETEFWVGTTAATWDDRPSAYQIFAEKASPNIQIDGGETGGGLFSTGSSFRALLPLEKQERTALAEYRGPGALVDTRVACVSPYITRLSVWDFEASSRVGTDSSSTQLRVYGLFTADTFGGHADELAARGFLTSNQLSNVTGEMQFDCRTPRTLMGDDGSDNRETFLEWKTTLCLLYDTNFTRAIQVSDTSDFYDGVLDIGIVVLNMTGYDESWALLDINNQTGIGFGERDGEWTKISYPMPEGANETAKTLDLSISICFTSFRSVNALITARADWNLTEATLSKSHGVPRYNTTAIRNQLGVATGGVGDLDHEKRGILKMADINYTSIAEFSIARTYIEGSLLDQNLGRTLTMGLYQFPTARMCIWCYPDILVHEGFISIFGDTLAATARPALAIQALFTARVLQIYNNRAPDFTVVETVKASFFSPFQVPTMLKGFYIVSSFVAFHFFMMMYMTFLFFKIEGQTSLGQAWQTFGQVQSEDLQEVMAVGKTLNDSDVKEWLLQRGEYDNLIGIREGEVVTGGTLTRRVVVHPEFNASGPVHTPSMGYSSATSGYAQTTGYGPTPGYAPAPSYSPGPGGQNQPNYYQPSKHAPTLFPAREHLLTSLCVYSAVKVCVSTYY